MKIIAAIIGTGIGEKHFEAIEKYKRSKVKIICEKNKLKLKALKKKYPNQIITNDENLIFNDAEINLVSIASYDQYHFSQIIKSIDSKKHIIIEKPMCLTVEQLVKIKKKLNKNKKIKIISNMVLRENSLFKYFKKKIKSKKIYYIEGDYIWGRKHKLFEWRSKIKDYSITLGAGIHLIDLIMWLTKKRPISVFATGNKLITQNTIFKKESFVVIIFKFPNDLIVKITANAVAVYEHFHELKIFCQNETYVNSRLGSFSYKKKIFKQNLSNYPDKKNRKRLIRSFINNLITQKKNDVISLKEQIDLMSVCFAVDKSLKLNKLLKIKYH